MGDVPSEAFMENATPNAIIERPVNKTAYLFASSAAISLVGLFNSILPFIPVYYITAAFLKSIYF